MIRIAFILMLLVSLAACDDENIKPVLQYRADFDPTLVDRVEKFMRIKAKKWEFVIFQKNREQMKYLTHGQEAFFMAFYHKDEAILDISNVGAGRILSLSLFDYGKLPLAILEDLANEIVTDLESQLNIQLRFHNGIKP